MSKHQLGPELLEQVRARDIARMATFKYFRLKSYEPCPVHGDTRGIIYRYATQQHVFQSYMRGVCQCDLYGLSEAALRVHREAGEVREIRS